MNHSVLIAAIVLPVLFICITVIKKFVDDWSESQESKSIRSDMENFRQELMGKARAEEEPSDSEKTALELREYYEISKRQAKRSFSSAMLACYFGFALFGLAVVIALNPSGDSGSDGAQYSAIGGAVVEVIAGLFFWMYTQASNQMKGYFNSQLETYRYQEAVELARELEGQDRVKAYNRIIDRMISGEAEGSDSESDSDSE